MLKLVRLNRDRSYVDTVQSYIDILREVGRAREKLEEHAGSWESTQEVRRARVKFGEHAGSWESTRGKLGEHEKG